MPQEARPLAALNLLNSNFYQPQKLFIEQRISNTHF